MNKKNNILLLNLIYFGIISGFLVGLVKSISLISANKYYDYGLNNLILYSLQEDTTKYAIAGLIITIFIIALSLVVRKVTHLISSWQLSGKQRFYLLLLFLILNVIIIAILYFNYLDIVNFLKSNSFTKWLGILSNSREETYQLFLIAIMILVIIVTCTVIYLFLEKSVVRFVNLILHKLSHPAIKYLGIAVFFSILISTIYIFFYQRIYIPDGPNIVIITVDTLRADHLGSYGYHKNISPNIDNLARDGILFEKAYSQAPWTLPSMASMHTSEYPSTLNIFTINDKIHPEFITLAEYLRNKHYKTIGVISNLIVSNMYGFSQGFEIFDGEFISDLEDVSSEQVTDRAQKYINQYRNQPFFLWVHYYDPHYSYVDHDDIDYGSGYEGRLPDKLDIKLLNHHKENLSDKDIQYVKDLYDEEISFTDKNIGELIDSIRELGLIDNTIIVFTADHGEELMDRNRFGHGKDLYQELIHVPLIIYVPGDPKLRNKTIGNNVELRNIPYTILEFAGIDQDHFGGINLLELGEQDTYPVYSLGSYAWGEDSKKEGIISENWKLIKNLDDNTYELYDLITDPFEKQNLIDDPNSAYPVKDLKAELDNMRKERASVSNKVKLNKDDVERLKALGYLQ